MHPRLAVSDSSTGSLARPVQLSPRRHVLALAVLLLGSLADRSEAQLGQWSGPYPWPYVIAPPTGQTTDKEISHAALIPAGPHAGKVLIFSWEGQGFPDTDTFWFFNPDAPTDLVRLSQNVHANIFCSGMSFDAQGHLLVVGGIDVTHGSPPNRTLKLDPFRLGPIMYEIGGSPPGFMRCLDADGLPWRALGDMALKRFYPTVIPLTRRALSFANTDPPTPPIAPVPAGGANLVLGGPPSTATCSTADGNEAWEVLPFRASSWRPPFAPPQPNIVHTSDLPPSLQRETYSLHGTPAPHVLLDSYPRAAQFSNGDIHVAGDVDTLRQGIAPPDSAWVFKPYTAGGPTPDWQLHRAQPDVERYYGTAWLMHFGFANGGLDRWFHAGGSRDLTPDSYPGGSCTQNCTDPPNPVCEQLTDGLALDSVSELENTGALPQDRQWRSRANLTTPRVFVNGVVLPTGQVLLTGGARKDYHRPYMNSVPKCPDPVYAPELYDVGIGFNDTNQPAPMLLATSNVLGTHALPTPRLYHHIALLLTDGRVLVAGGQIPDYTNSPCAPAPDFSPPQHTGEMFSPPYMSLSYRPTWTSPPLNVVDLSPQPGSVVTFNANVQVLSGHVIRSVVLLRPGVVTHHFDSDQRYIELEFSVTVEPDSTTTLTVESPRENLAPPGYYMIFVNVAPTSTSSRSTWAPSVGHFVKFQ